MLYCGDDDSTLIFQEKEVVWVCISNGGGQYRDSVWTPLHPHDAAAWDGVIYQPDGTALQLALWVSRQLFQEKAVQRMGIWVLGEKMEWC